jgi:hypothetical protein
MSTQSTSERARRDAKKGESPSTQAGEFVREEIHHVREGVHGARSVQQAIAIGLSKARRAGVKLPPPKKGTASAAVRKQAARDLDKGRSRRGTSRIRSRAIMKALKRESHATASRGALAAQARASARRRGPIARHRAAMEAVQTKGPRGIRRAARKAARTRRKMG